jgi:NADH:ubiquinone oxidoreductase subunit 3 (subunit A)
MTGYQLFLLCVLILWPLAIMGMLFLMSRLERAIDKPAAETPQEAGLEPVEGRPREREVQIVFGDKVIGEPAPKEMAKDIEAS